MTTPRLIAVLLALSMIGAAAPPSAPEPARPVDAAKLYTGTWIEIARHPEKLTDGCIASGTRYTRTGDDKVAVLDFCHDKTVDGKLKTIGGPATITDPGTNAKLHVSYRFLGFVPVARDYWVLDHADDYRWFISANPAFTDLWIYTRDTHPDPALVKTLVGKAKAMGYDPSQLEFPAQP